MPEGQFGRYQLIEEIGRGGFATVYKARDNYLNRLVALKVLHAHYSNNPSFVRRFQREANTIAQLDHPNIISIYDVGAFDRHLFISLKFLPDGDLGHRLKQHPLALSLEETLLYLRPIAAALDYAHQENIVHRDLKPGNILLDYSRSPTRVVLTDFGLVKALDESASLTSPGTTMGSFQYMAPEQADPNQHHLIGPATDRYALGIIAYQMLAGRVPFPNNTHGTLNAHINMPVPDPRQFSPTMSPRMANILMKMLSKNPYDRYVSSSSFVGALELAGRVVTKSQPPKLGVYRKPNPLKENVGNTKVPLWIPLLIIGLIVLALTLAYFSLQLNFAALSTPTNTGMVITETPTLTLVSHMEEPQLDSKITFTPSVEAASTSTMALVATSTPAPTQTATPLPPTRTPRATFTIASIFQAEVNPSMVLLAPLNCAPVSSANITFEWEWPGELEADQYLEVRVRGVSQGRINEDARIGENEWSIILPASNFSNEDGDIRWRVYLMQGISGGSPIELSISSNTGCFANSSSSPVDTSPLQATNLPPADP